MVIASLLAAPPLELKLSRYKTLSRPDLTRDAKLIDFLGKHRFATHSQVLSEAHLFLVQAHLNTCSMDLREVAPQGWDRSAMKAIAAGRPLFYVDNGQVSSEQPAWRTWIYYHIRRFSSLLGWSLPRRLTFAVISTGLCDDLNWAELSAFMKDNEKLSPLGTGVRVQRKLALASL